MEPMYEKAYDPQNNLIYIYECTSELKVEDGIERNSVHKRAVYDQTNHLDWCTYMMSMEKKKKKPI